MVIAGVVAAAAAGAGWVFVGGADEDGPTYRLARVERGPIESTVTASGTLGAVVTVEVGSQVSGQIKELAADFNTPVKAGQVIARLDPAMFEAKVLQADAELAVARSNVSMQRAALAELEADTKGARAALSEAREELKRKRALLARRVVSKSQVEKALAVNDQAVARVDAVSAKVRRQQAQIENALAQVKQKEAALKQRLLDLEHTIIRSPVDGVVISRSVDTGQTVAASLQAPTLFTIAQDLRSMQVEVSVDEADIGQVQIGQKAKFTVDSFAGREFPGRIRQIRKAPAVVSNVVTYTVVVTADNPDLRLLPGMTANVVIVVGERENALRVPNSALRFRPAGAAAAAPVARDGQAGSAVNGRARSERTLARMVERLKLSDQQQTAIRAIFAETGQKIRAMRQQGMERSEIRAFVQKVRAQNRPRIAAILDEEQRKRYLADFAARAADAVRRGRLWLLGDDGGPRPVDVAYGISDGTMTEIVGGDIAEGQQVIAGAVRKPAAAAVRSRRPRFGF